MVATKKTFALLCSACFLCFALSGTASAAGWQSIKNWASCNGSTDDRDALATAITAARNNAFTLVIDCPIRVKIGMDAAKPIFIDNNTTIEFTKPWGKITVDNTLVPAFVIANSAHIALKDWVIEYDASLPIKQPNYYMLNGQTYGGTYPGGAFNEVTMTSWLSANRGIKFDRANRWASAMWADPTNVSAIFFVTGTSQFVIFDGMKMYAPPGAGADRFIPVAFSINNDWKNNQYVSSATPRDSRFLEIPSDLKFLNISLDGTYFGWVGIGKNIVIDNVTSNRYGDLQDKNGNYVGGVNKWFAPPHLFYWSISQFTDQKVWSRNIQITNVNDLGVRLGTARDRGTWDSFSGYAPSLKIACIDCIVDTYRSARPDGFMDVLPSSNLVIANVTATYNSDFTHNLYQGLRWPSEGYKAVTLENVSLKDTAPTTYKVPLGSTTGNNNDGIVLTNVTVNMNKWSGQGSMIPSIISAHSEVHLDYTVGAGATRAVLLQKSPESVFIKATPAALSVGQSTFLQWMGRNVNSCAGTGAWSETVRTASNKTVKFTKPGVYDYTITCRNSNQTVASTVRVAVR